MPIGKISKLVLCGMISLFLLNACSKKLSDLEIIKQYQPVNKYFKAGMKSLFFRIETNDTGVVDSLMLSFFEKNSIPLDASDCADGIFKAESPYDAYDFKHIVEIEIRDEKIVSVYYDEITNRGLSKRDDAHYNEEMGKAGTPPERAYPQMENSIIKKQNMNEIDAMTGATYSLFRFKYVLGIALMKAKIETQNKMKQEKI